LSASFFSIISIAWLVRSMDAFIKIVEEKKEAEDDVNLHERTLEKLETLVSAGKNVFITGSDGVGKTYVLRKFFSRRGDGLELLSEHVKAKNNFLELISSSAKHVYLDDYDPEFKSVVELVSSGGRLTRGSFIVTSTNMFMLPNFQTIIIPPHSPDKLALLTPQKFSMDAAIRSKGNIRNYLSYNEGYDSQDIFMTPKEVIHDLLSNVASKYTSDHVHEHGHMYDIFQTNYLDSPGVDVVRSASSFSDADVFDCVMYNEGSWALMPYFINTSMSRPKFYMGMPLKKETIKPGSAWTKHGNMRMRQEKIKSIRADCPVMNANLDVDTLCLLHKYAKSGHIDQLVTYNISPVSFDVMNHLCISSKLKARDVTMIKKLLKDAISSQK